MRCTAFAVVCLMSALLSPAAQAQIDFGHVFRNLSALSAPQDSSGAQTGDDDGAGAVEDEPAPALPELSEPSDADAAELELLEPSADELDAPPAPPAEPEPDAAVPESTDPAAQPIPHSGTVSGFQDPAVPHGSWYHAPRSACGGNCGVGFSHYGQAIRPLTVNQLFAPPPHVQGLWETYPQEFYEAEEKRRALRYPKPRPRWLGCNEDGIYIGPTPYPFPTGQCDSIAKKPQDAASKGRISR